MLKKAVVLLSGGLDSQIALHLAISQGFECYAISFNYGQRHLRELNAAKQIAHNAGVKHQIVQLNLNDWGGSSLTDQNLPIEKGNLTKSHIPNTYVPARNMIFLSLAASWAEILDASHIFIGISQVDYSGYVDCREEFIRSMEATINLGTVKAVEKKSPFTLVAPFQNSTKADEIRLGAKLGVDFGLSWSCYEGGDKPCRVCDSCLLRMKAFEEAGIIDPSYL